MFAWKVRCVEHHVLGARKWNANIQEGYASEIDGVALEVVSRVCDAEKFESRDLAESFRDTWVREFEAQGGTIDVGNGEFHDISLTSSWELVEL